MFNQAKRYPEGMHMKMHSWLNKSLQGLVVAGAALAALAGVSGPRTANAQSLTLSFRFDDGSANPAVNFASLASSKAITSANNGQSFTIDVFATVTGTGGTAQNNLGLQSVLYRGASSSLNNGA